MTNAERHLLTLFAEALELASPPERAAYLDRACGDDQALRQQVEGLLQAHAQVGRFLDPQAAAAGATSSAAGVGVAAAPVEDQPTLPQPAAETAGTVIGPYKLLEQIGEGGMGAVWMAQQTQPVKRLVAVKLIKAGMDSKQVIARFEAERQALALMDHPNIARVFDAGVTEEGRPFFVMELVKGVTITKFCDDRRLTPRQRLELFLPVCHAIQHAHQKGIIHRDIKPSNVLIALYDDKPVPKVIDFGVAKATGQQLTELSLHTGFGAVVGTLEYMSPEQASFNQLDIDTRSDIYSLGVLLYELLAGSPPFIRRELEKAGMLEMLRVIRECDPAKPSTKLSSSDTLASLSTNRGTDPARLTKLLRGELDWIVMKALDKDRARRYETANGFAADVQRYLSDEPVQACPPSARYRLAKFARRNKAVLTGVLLAGALLLLTTAVTSWLAFWALAERRLALEAEGRATQRLYESLVAQAQASRYSGRDGHRYKSLDALAEAASLLGTLDIAPEAREQERLKLRNEAIAAMALTDLKLARSWELPGLGDHDEVAFDSDLQQYAFSDARGEVLVYRVADNQLVRRLPGSGTRVGLLWFSPDDQFLAVNYGPANKRQVRVWDLRTGQPVIEPMDSYGGVAFSPDGRLLAQTAADGNVGVFDLRSGKRVAQVNALPSPPHAISFSPDGKKLAMGKWEGKEVVIVDADNGKVLARLAFPATSGAGFKALAWHPDGRLLATTWRNSIYLWDVESNPREPRAVLEGHQGAVVYLAFNRAGLLASRGWDSTLRLWDPWLAKHLVSIASLQSPQFSRDGRRLAYRHGSTQRLGVLDVLAADECRLVPPPMVGIDFSLDPTLIALSTSNGVKLLDAATGSEVAALPGVPMGTIEFDRTTGDLLTGGMAGLVRWPFTLCKQEGCWKIGPPRRVPGSLGIQMPSFTLASKGHSLLVGVNSSRGVVLHADQPGNRVVLQGPSGALFGPSISPDGRWAATGTRGPGGVRIWDAHTGEMLLQLPGTEAVRVAKVTFSPDGKWLATGDSREVRFWEVGTWQPGRRIVRDNAGDLVGDTAFSPDGKMLVYPHSNRLAKLIDVATGAELATLPTPHVEMQRCGFTFSPDGCLLVAKDEQLPMRIWDLRRVRAGLQAIGLDWEMPPYPEPEVRQGAVRVELDGPAIERFAATEAHFAAGAAHAKAKRWEPASDAYTKAVELDPAFAGAWRIRGNCRLQMGRWEEAIADLTRSIDLDPKVPETWYDRGYAYTRKERRAEALADFRSALKLNPNDVGVLRHTAWILVNAPDEKLRNPKEAIELAGRAVKGKPNDGWSWLALGVAHYRAGNWEKAREALDKATELYKSGDAQANFVLAMVHRKLGNVQAARDAYDRGVLWMETNEEALKNKIGMAKQMGRFRAEAEEVLELNKD